MAYKPSVKELEIPKQPLNDRRLSSVAKKNVLKVAVRAPTLPALGQLFEVDQNLSLKKNISNFCQKCHLPNPESYAFQYLDTKLYITESTRDMMKNGDVLWLAVAPEYIVENIMSTLKQSSNNEKRIEAYDQLAQCSSDPTFSAEFIENHGIRWLVNIIQNGESNQDVLGSALSAFLELMAHGLESWDTVLSIEFLRTIISFVNATSDIKDRILQHCLGILELAVINSQKFYSEIQRTLVVENLMMHLHRSNSDIQQSAIALLNCLFMKAQGNKENLSSLKRIADIMSQKQFRTVVLNNVIRTVKPIESEMAHQLHVLQVLMFSTFEERMMAAFDATAADEYEKLFELKSIAFDSSQQGLQGNKKIKGAALFDPVDFKKLGFVTYNDPKYDFIQTPPGLLALDAMLYFARNQQDNYIRLILENSSRHDDKYVCPFGKSSIEVTKKLCKILKIGEQPADVSEDFYPMFFTHDHGFEEFFCICIQLFNKTWKEMGAIVDDFDKVLGVVQDQIELALENRPPSLDAFKQKLQPYSKILEIRQQKLKDKAHWDSQAKPVVELQQEIKPQILDLIRQQRLAYLKEGTVFPQKKQKKWYCRLSSDLKVFHYGDVDDSEKTYSIDSLPNKLSVADIKELLIGKNCPHMKNAKGQKNITELAFSIVQEPDNQSLNFITQTKDEWYMWIDGINVLLNKKMTSPQAKSDLDLLLSMEMKLRLLDLENTPIPDNPPEIPPLPTNYNFASLTA